jgi:hypothetical protein
MQRVLLRQCAINTADIKKPHQGMRLKDEKPKEQNGFS